MEFRLIDSNKNQEMRHVRSCKVSFPLGGGSGNNETLSMKQAIKIVVELNKIMTLCKNQIETKDSDFIKKLSTIWEDQNAINFIKEHQKELQEVLTKNLQEMFKENNIDPMLGLILSIMFIGFLIALAFVLKK